MRKMEKDLRRGWSLLSSGDITKITVLGAERDNRTKHFAGKQFQKKRDWG